MKKEKIYISGKISGLTEKEYKENAPIRLFKKIGLIQREL
jgi:hypothetical protein